MMGTILIHIFWVADGSSFILFIPLCPGVKIIVFIPPYSTFPAQIIREFMHR